ncbi:bifunctional 4-hydroxy-2-oxoglutarate aldolase/2-dehydro-3-deoxy-phosphogluconate aldolase [Maribacter sp. HTCC2170]|uniref:bifunctional 4-hydroxy-2-oxoglutarate aldolase/2-dehydro-3-deoxy-phosphogluconate aldolase n=1 Tax=Maribacter sp. (strain HTCC2170 / KCCM 42371) TaxID=313603 RepID=UPI00006BD42D|nr:bifunctional 4-hydroxy-2-oxoglutarate aldolase/2-dehydro-3-deoxy-phosphogluconate aldolase [Maribacter sp. HTCC2170]EAR02025.1 hypothetical protein FB2170_02040 [Maribacter sp. HTCC2170]
MKRKEVTNIIEKEKIVAIIRLKKQSEVDTVIKGLILGGIKVLEITSNTPGFNKEIKKARDSYPNILIGAGTVVNTSIAKIAIEAGAQFLVTPNTNIDVLTLAHENDVPVLMGAFTPSEICLAIEYGADIIKLFPAGNLGIDYFKAIQGPLNDAKFFIVGGINLENIQEWFKAGVSGVGIGSVLTNSPNEEICEETIKNKAQEFINLIKNF